jgi:hypothetical protein
VSLDALAGVLLAGGGCVTDAGDVGVSAGSCAGDELLLDVVLSLPQAESAINAVNAAAVVVRLRRLMCGRCMTLSLSGWAVLVSPS